MTDKLARHELDKIIEKLRSQYDEQRKLYGPNCFNLDAFNDRYLAALKNRIDLQTFVYAEVTALEELKKMVQDKIRERTIRTEKPFTKKIEKMIHEMSEKTRKYPALFPDSGLPEEFQHLCGAAQDFHDDGWLVLERLFEKDDLKTRKTHAEISSRLQKYFLHSKGGVSFEADRFFTMERQEGVDKAHIGFLREAAVLLRDALGFLEGLELKGPDEQVQFPHPAEGTGRFEAKSRLEVLGLVRSDLESLITDFRLTDLV
jgi:hypothetical protein